MARDLEPAPGKSVGASLGTKAVAVVVLLVAAYVLFIILKSILFAIAVPVIVILALVGIWWGWRTLR